MRDEANPFVMKRCAILASLKNTNKMMMKNKTLKNMSPALSLIASPVELSHPENKSRRTEISKMSAVIAPVVLMS